LELELHSDDNLPDQEELLGNNEKVVSLVEASPKDLTHLGVLQNKQ
jgi:hypothetical protein